LTKEPKLDRARRQVPEWESYDKEVAAFAARIFQSQKVSITESNIQSKSTIEVSSESVIPVKITTHEDL
jgi:UDP-glucose:glycoprotein glucosyltransferase